MFSAIIKFAQIVSTCYNSLNTMETCHLNHYSIVLCENCPPPELRTKWLFKLSRDSHYQASVIEFSDLLNDVAFVHDGLVSQFPSCDRSKQTNFTREKTKTSTMSLSISKPGNQIHTPCPMKDGDHKIYSCAKFKSLTTTQRYEAAKRNNFCFSCLWSLSHQRLQSRENVWCERLYQKTSPTSSL